MGQGLLFVRYVLRIESLYRLKRSSEELAKHPYTRLGSLTPRENIIKIVILEGSVG